MRGAASFPVLLSHSLIEPSLPTAASVRESGANATFRTSGLSSRVARPTGRPPTTFQTSMTPFRLAAASLRPSGLKAAPMSSPPTLSELTATGRLRATSQTRSRPSPCAAASMRPFGANEIPDTPARGPSSGLPSSRWLRVSHSRIVPSPLPEARTLGFVGSKATPVTVSWCPWRMPADPDIEICSSADVRPLTARTLEIDGGARRYAARASSADMSGRIGTSAWARDASPR